MKASAPNLPWFGFQSVLVMYESPILANAGHARCVVEITIAARTTSVVSPAVSATIRNARSAPAPRPLPVRASSGFSVVATATDLLGADLAQLVDGLLGQR